MPIYDMSYRPYRGTLSTHTWRWRTIAKAGLTQHLSRRVFLIFLFIAYIHPIVRGVLIWGTHQLNANPFEMIDAQFFRNTLLGQGLFLLLVSIWIGAPLIAHDLKTNAIQLYLARPLTRIDYVVGKFAIIAGVGSILLPVPALLLYLMELGLSTDTKFLTANFWVPLAILAYSILVVGGAGLIILAISSMTRSGRYAGLLFFALVFFSQAGAGLLQLITGLRAFAVLSLVSLADQIGAICFGGPTEEGVHLVPTLLMYSLLMGLSVLVLRRRVKAVEIVT
ncbi:MAG TPA: hypothetical protein VGK94_08720 [Candidatus Polarisedimenticolia bacterium]